MHESPMNPRTRLYALTGIGLVFLLPRLWMLRESAYYDEHWTMLEMDAPNLWVFWERQAISDPPSTLIPVYFTAQYLWSQLTAQSFLAARAFALIMSLATGVTFYFVGRRLVGERGALLGLLLLALSLSHINYSVEVRLYPMTLLLAMFSMLTFLRVVENGSGWRWFAHIVVNVLLTWTHLMATPLFLVQWIWLVVYRKEHRASLRIWTSWHFLILFGLGYWLDYAWDANVSDVALWIPIPTLADLAVSVLVFAGGRPTNWAIGEYLPFGVSMAFVLVLVCIAMAVNAFRVRDKDTVLLALWALFPPLFLFAVSFLVQPIFLYRYCLYASFGLVLLCARGVMSLEGKRVQCAVGVLIVVCHLYQASVLTRTIRPDYAGAARDILAQQRDGDRVLGFRHINSDGLAYNDASGELQVAEVRSWNELIRIVGNRTSQDGTVWACFWRWDTLPEFEDALDMMELQHERREYGGIPPMWVYEIYARESD